MDNLDHQFIQFLNVYPKHDYHLQFLLTYTRNKAILNKILSPLSFHLHFITELQFLSFLQVQNIQKGDQILLDKNYFNYLFQGLATNSKVSYLQGQLLPYKQLTFQQDSIILSLNIVESKKIIKQEYSRVEDIKSQLRIIWFFSSITPYQLDRICFDSCLFNRPQGFILQKNNEIVEFLYVLISGECIFQTEIENGYKSICLINEGQILNEQSISGPSLFQIVCQTQVELVQIPFITINELEIAKDLINNGKQKFNQIIKAAQKIKQLPFIQQEIDISNDYIHLRDSPPVRLKGQPIQSNKKSYLQTHCKFVDKLHTDFLMRREIFQRTHNALIDSQKCNKKETFSMESSFDKSFQLKVQKKLLIRQKKKIQYQAVEIDTNRMIKSRIRAKSPFPMLAKGEPLNCSLQQLYSTTMPISERRLRMKKKQQHLHSI